MTRNRHLDLEIVARLCKLPSIVDRVARLFGSDLILWRSQFFLQTGRPEEGLGWHRDLYLNLLGEPRTSLSVHLAVTEASGDNCVLILPGTHKMSTEQIASEHGSCSRIAMGMRITVPSVKVLPFAFADTLPKVHRCVLLRGNNSPDLNELLPWPQ
jgi:hypothetical protein